MTDHLHHSFMYRDSFPDFFEILNLHWKFVSQSILVDWNQLEYNQGNQN